MKPDVVWGTLVLIWVAVVAIPYLWFSVQSIRGGDGDGFKKYGLAWCPGFVVIVALSNQDTSPEIGIAWSIIYALGIVAGFLWQRQQTMLARLYHFRPFRAFFAGTVLWVVVVQAWGYVTDWSYDYDYTQFAVINLAPPTLALVGWFALRWVRAA